MPDIKKVLNINNIRRLYIFTIISFIIYNLIYRNVFINQSRGRLINDFTFNLSLNIIIIIFFVAFFTVFFYIGNQIKEIFGFKYITTGIVSFFAITFILNILLAILKISSPKNELIIVYILTSIFLLISNVKANGVKAKLINASLIIVSLISIYQTVNLISYCSFLFRYLPEIDENYFWYPMTVRYYDYGLLYAVKNNICPSYGLFVQHIFVIIKRLLFFKPDLTFYFLPKLLFILGLGFILEIKVSKGVKILTILFFMETIFADTWLRFLLINSLYGEGITCLFFAIVFRELVESNKYYENIKIIREAPFWITSGVLNMLKPTVVAYLFFVFPILCFKRRQKLKSIMFIILRIILMIVFPLLLIIVNKNSSDFTMPSVNCFNYRIILPILKNLTVNKATFAFYFLSISGALLGIRAYNKFKIITSVGFIFTIFFIIYVWYATVYANRETGSSYRYCTEVYYLCLYAFALGMQEIISCKCYQLCIKYFCRIKKLLTKMYYSYFLNKVVIIMMFLFICFTLIYIYTVPLDRVCYIRFEAEKYPAFIGAKVGDKEAGNCMARVACVKIDGKRADLLVYGPWKKLMAGNYIVRFRMKISDNKVNKPVVRIDVNNPKKSGSLVVEKNICGVEFYKSNQYQDFFLEFNHDGEGDLEFRVHFLGETDLWVDYVEVKG